MMKKKNTTQHHANSGMVLASDKLQPFMIRTIHPVGHGAFHTEQFIVDGKSAACTVYDCGSITKDQMRNFSPLQREIDNGLDYPAEEIDILFVSHLDADHINGIGALKKYRIKNVVLPLMYREKEMRLSLFLYELVSCGFTMDNDESKQLCHIICHLEEVDVLRNGAKIIYVSANTDVPPEETDLDNLDNGAIVGNYSKIAVSILGWRYILFNMEESRRYADFHARIKKDPNLANLNENDIDKWITNPSVIAVLKEIYKQLPGKENGNSLMVCSTPVEPAAIRTQAVCQGNGECEEDKNLHSKSGCLYLGDINVTKKLVKTIKSELGKAVSSLGAIQIPHHGSGSGDSSLLLDINPSVVYYFLSCSEKRRKNSPKFWEDIGKTRMLLCITEDEETRCTMEYRKI